MISIVKLGFGFNIKVNIITINTIIYSSFYSLSYFLMNSIQKQDIKPIFIVKNP